MNQYSVSFRSLVVWQEAKKLALDVYKATTQFPKYELYALTSQIGRSSSSVMANIAEGNERRSVKDRLHFFAMSRSSLAETDCHLELCFELGYLAPESYELLLSKINKTSYLLNRFILSQ